MAAIITASGAVAAGAFQLLKPTAKGSHTSSIGAVSDSSVGSLSNSIDGPVTDSMLAVGANITQTFSRTVHNHYTEPAHDESSFSSKVESRPTIAEMMDDLNTARTLHGVYPPPTYLRTHNWSVRLHSIHNDMYAVNLDLDLEKYPRLKVADRGDRAWVEGQIKSTSSYEVYLEDGAILTLE